MGEVYLFEDVLSGRRPNVGKFLHHAQAVISRPRVFVGGVVCGSTVIGGSNRRSDVEIVTVYHDKWEQKALESLNKLFAYGRDECGVSFDPIPFSESDARSRWHTMRPLLYEQTCWAANCGGNIGGDIMGIFSLWHTQTGEVEDFLRKKLDAMRKARIAVPHADRATRYKLLQKTLELPYHVARVLLWADGYENAAVVPKTGLVAAFLDAKWVNDVLSKDFTALVIADQMYSNELEKQCAVPNREAYEQHICQLESHAYAYALDFMRGAIDVFEGIRSKS